MKTKKTKVIKLKHKDGIVLIDDKKYHLYFINDDEIKDVFYNTITNKVGAITNYINAPLKAVISTTDEYYNKKYNLPQPSQAFIEKYVKLGGIDEVLVELEEFTNCSKEYKTHITFNYKVCKYCKRDLRLKVNSHNEITIHSIKNSWNREEVIDLINKHTFEFDGKNRTIKELNEWENKNL